MFIKLKQFYLVGKASLHYIGFLLQTFLLCTGLVKGPFLGHRRKQGDTALPEFGCVIVTALFNEGAAVNVGALRQVHLIEDTDLRDLYLVEIPVQLLHFHKVAKAALSGDDRAVVRYRLQSISSILCANLEASDSIAGPVLLL